MNTHTALRRAGRIEYALWRTPLTILDEQVVQRFLSEDTTVRRSFERLLDTLDDAATRWLADPQAHFTPSPATSTSPQTEYSAPTDPIEVPQPEPAAEPEQTVETRQSVVAEQIEELAEELLEEEETEPLAGELAENDELRRVQAELNAKRLLAEQQGD